MKFKKKNIAAIVIICTIIPLAIVYVTLHWRSESAGQISNVSIAGHVFSVEVVSKENEMEKGLSGRDNLCQSCGMLFQFARPGKYSFWMKDMRLPLDILWIDSGRVAAIEKNIAPTFSGTLSPESNAEQVLEINAGLVDAYDIKIGDAVKL